MLFLFNLKILQKSWNFLTKCINIIPKDNNIWKCYCLCFQQPLYSVEEQIERREALHFIKFETKYIEDCLNFIQQNLLSSKCIKATGITNIAYSLLSLFLYAQCCALCKMRGHSFGPFNKQAALHDKVIFTSQFPLIIQRHPKECLFLFLFLVRLTTNFKCCP